MQGAPCKPMTRLRCASAGSVFSVHFSAARTLGGLSSCAGLSCSVPATSGLHKQSAHNVSLPHSSAYVSVNSPRPFRLATCTPEVTAGGDNPGLCLLVQAQRLTSSDPCLLPSAGGRMPVKHPTSSPTTTCEQRGRPFLAEHLWSLSTAEASFISRKVTYRYYCYNYRPCPV